MNNTCFNNISASNMHNLLPGKKGGQKEHSYV
uniref:Uncharacterized protein n=1 Tax=Rhizophora mucronata TaxID=61149 RepID=A0A2P2N353_RHIMU